MRPSPRRRGTYRRRYGFKTSRARLQRRIDIEHAELYPCQVLWPEGWGAACTRAGGAVVVARVPEPEGTGRATQGGRGGRGARRMRAARRMQGTQPGDMCVSGREPRGAGLACGCCGPRDTLCTAAGGLLIHLRAFFSLHVEI